MMAMFFPVLFAMAVAVIVVVVIAAIIVIAIITVAFAALVAVIVAQSTTRTATGGRADQTAGVAADALADDITARRAKATANSRFGAITPVGTDRTTRGAANTGTNGRARVATDLLADDRAQNPAKRATNTCFSSTASKGRATHQAKGQNKNRGIFHFVRRTSVGMWARSWCCAKTCARAHRRILGTCTRFVNICFYGRTWGEARWSEAS